MTNDTGLTGASVTQLLHNAPTNPITVSVRVRSRWDDCDQYGHVNNAAYLAIVRAAHDRAGVPGGILCAARITYREPLAGEVMVDVDVGVGEETEQHRRVAYTLRVDGRTAADVSALWSAVGPSPRPDLPTVARDAGGRRFEYRQDVRSYEVGPDGTARPQAVLQWLEHAVFRAATRAGWPRDRMASADFLTYVIGHDLVLGEPAHEGDELVVTSRLIELRRVSGTWHHEVRRHDGALVAIDRARGAFLGLDGRVRQAPRALLDDLLRGEPPG